MEDDQRYCLFDGKPLSGRSDKKYCNADCKNAHINELNKEENKEVRRINNLLAKNRRVLKAHYESEDRKEGVKKEVMIRRGFSFDYVTQFYGGYMFCYEFGYTAIGTNKDYIKVVKGFDSIVKKE